MSKPITCPDCGEKFERDNVADTYEAEIKSVEAAILKAQGKG